MLAGYYRKKLRKASKRKKANKGIKIFLKKRKTKPKNMVVKNTKIFLKIKNKD